MWKVLTKKIELENVGRNATVIFIITLLHWWILRSKVANNLESTSLPISLGMSLAMSLFDLIYVYAFIAPIFIGMLVSIVLLPKTYLVLISQLLLIATIHTYFLINKHLGHSLAFDPITMNLASVVIVVCIRLVVDRERKMALPHRHCAEERK